MTDQCKNCALRGDYEECRSAPCFHHENWFQQEQNIRIDELESKLSEVMFFLSSEQRCHLIKKWSKDK